MALVASRPRRLEHQEGFLPLAVRMLPTWVIGVVFDT
jgi:hypothetical protein